MVWGVSSDPAEDAAAGVFATQPWVSCLGDFIAHASIILAKIPVNDFFFFFFILANTLSLKVSATSYKIQFMQNTTPSNYSDFAVTISNKKKKPETSEGNGTSFNNFPNILLKFAVVKLLPLSLKTGNSYFFSEAVLYLH